MHDHKLEAQGLRLVIHHIQLVQQHMTIAIATLMARTISHDYSKYSKEEIGLVLGKPSFDKFEYMSKEERAALESVKDSLVYHYARNSHHPEFYKNGIDGMTLLDLLEMACDWKAASEMSANGSFEQSVEYNKERFGLSDQLVNILLNTRREMGWLADRDFEDREV
jgi:hypothetical protein